MPVLRPQQPRFNVVQPIITSLCSAVRTYYDLKETPWFNLEEPLGRIQSAEYQLEQVNNATRIFALKTLYNIGAEMKTEDAPRISSSLDRRSKRVHQILYPIILFIENLSHITPAQLNLLTREEADFIERQMIDYMSDYCLSEQTDPFLF